MPIWLKQSTSVVISFGPFVSPTDGVTLQTGLVSAIDHASTGIFLSKNGGTLTIRHASVTASTYDAYGNYKVTLDTTDTGTLGTLRMQFAAAASCLVVWQDFMVVPANVWDSYFGADILDVSVTQWLGSAVTAATAGIPDANAKNINNVATTSVTTINANQGTTQPVNYTGTGASALVKSDAVDIAGAAVSATTAQIGVNVVNWNNTVVATPATAGIPDVNVKNIDNDAASASGTVTFPNATLASTTNITAGTITTVSGNVNGNVGGNVTGSVGSVLGNVAGNVTGSVGTMTAAFAAQFFTLNSTKVYADAVSGSVVKEIATGTSGLATDPWNVSLPGAYASGKAGFILGTNVDALISSRMATYTQPTGFLAATFPGTVASTTNITAGIITTVSGNVNGNVGGNVTGTIGGFTVPAMAQFFTTNSGSTYSASVAGSVVKEIVTNTGSFGLAT